jgi:hypothetical protein
MGSLPEARGATMEATASTISFDRGQGFLPLGLRARSSSTMSTIRP